MRLRLLHALLGVAACAALTGCGGGGSTFDPALSGAPAPTFQLAVGPGSRTVMQGSSAAYTVTLTAVNGFATSVTPTASGLPAGATASFNPASVTPASGGASTTMTVTTTASGGSQTPAGTSNLTVSATSGSINQQAATSLVVTAPPPPGSVQGTIQ